jgi:hypothetical protein
MATLNIVRRFLAYEDGVSSNNPQRRPFDWSRPVQAIPVNHPACAPYGIQPLASVEIFDGTRTLGYNSATQYSLTVSSLASNRYRLKWTGVGTAPAFRTARTVAFGGGGTPVVTVTVAQQLNQSVAVTSSAGAIFGNVVAGDVVYIPGLTTGDSASIFDSMNEGFWSVLSATASQLVLARNPGEVYSAKSEVATIVSDTSFQVFSAAGVQLDDILSLVSGFTTALLQNYEIVAVTADSIEFLSGTTLPPLATVVPGAGSIVIFSDAKSWLYVETDQNISVSLNGNTSTFNVEPWQSGDSERPGSFELTGTAYSLTITNKSTVTATVKVLSAE